MTDNKIFKINILFLYIAIPASFIVSAYTIYITYNEAYKIELFVFPVIIVTISLVSFIFTVIYAGFFKTILKHDGIQGINSWGVTQHILWEDITNIKSINILGLSYLRVYSLDLHFTLWIPLFMKNMQMFEDLVKTLPPENNKLRIYFSNI